MYITWQQEGRDCPTDTQARCEVFRKSCAWNLNLDQWNRHGCRRGLLPLTFNEKQICIWMTKLHVGDRSTANKATCKADGPGITGMWRQAVSEDGSALFRSHFCACINSGNLDPRSNFHCIKFSQSYRPCALNHKSHYFQKVNTRPIHLFDTLFPSLYCTLVDTQ